VECEFEKGNYNNPCGTKIHGIFFFGPCFIISIKYQRPFNNSPTSCFIIYFHWLNKFIVYIYIRIFQEICIVIIPMPVFNLRQRMIFTVCFIRNKNSDTTLQYHLTTIIKKTIILKWHLLNRQIHKIHKSNNITTKHQNINIALS
jgi:hypothetical protein